MPDVDLRGQNKTLKKSCPLNFVILPRCILTRAAGKINHVEAEVAQPIFLVCEYFFPFFRKSLPLFDCCHPSGDNQHARVFSLESVALIEISDEIIHVEGVAEIIATCHK